MGIARQRHGDVVELTLDWPERRNALGPVEGRELRLAIEEATADPGAGAVLLSATGAAFCAGGDLRALVDHAKQGRDAVRGAVYGEFQGIFRAISQSPVPVVAAVDGPAIGFGCDLALAGNMTFIGDGGWIAQGWARAGLIPATGGTLYVARRGGAQAVWRLLAADRVDGPTAESWGLAVACTNARDAALAAANRFAALERKPLRALTELARIADQESHMERALEFQLDFLTSPEFAAFAARILGK